MPANLSALEAGLKLIADAAKDTAQAIKPGESLIGRLLQYNNLGADLVALIPNMGDIPAEVAALAPEDYVTLTQSLVTYLNITTEPAQGIIAAGLKLLNDIVTVLVPDIEGLVAAVKA